MQHLNTVRDASSNADRERDLDAACGRLFATEAGKLWIELFRSASDHHAFVCADITERVSRQRQVWGDKSCQNQDFSPPSQSSPLEPPSEPLEP